MRSQEHFPAHHLAQVALSSHLHSREELDDVAIGM
jgi:hypothetical protein